MSLLPGGERAPRSAQVCLSIALVWMGYQGFVNGVQVEPDDVTISFDQAKNAYLVSAPCRWTLDLPGHSFVTQTTLRAFVRKKMYLPPE